MERMELDAGDIIADYQQQLSIACHARAELMAAIKALEKQIKEKDAKIADLTNPVRNPET